MQIEDESRHVTTTAKITKAAKTKIYKGKSGAILQFNKA